MTPERILDLSVKFGVLPFVLCWLWFQRSDIQEQKKDIKELQILLTDCYKDQINRITFEPFGMNKDSVTLPHRFEAVLPEKTKIVKA
jgi:hypothetical protein